MAAETSVDRVEPFTFIYTVLSFGLQSCSIMVKRKGYLQGMLYTISPKGQKMRRTVLIGILLASVSAFAFGGPHDRMQPLFEELELTPAQKSKLTAIRKERRDKRIRLRDEMAALREQTRERILAVLDKEQQGEFKALRSAMRERRMAGGERPGSAKRQPRCER